MSELLNCPFCGGEAKPDRDGVLHFVTCKHCYARTGEFQSPTGAHDSALRAGIAAWNRRATPQADAAITAGGAQEAAAWRGAPLSLIPNLVDSNKVAVNVALLEMGDAMSTWRTESEKYGEITSRAQSAFCDGYEAGIAAILCAITEHAAPLPREAATAPDGDAVYAALDRRAQSYISREVVEDVLIAVRALLAGSNGEKK
jgi:hypothetical protein